MTHEHSPHIHEKRLIWLTRRGMKELDLLLGSYLQDIYPHASPAEQSAFVKLLGFQDPYIIDLLFERLEDDDAQVQQLLLFLRNYAQSKALFGV